MTCSSCGSAHQRGRFCTRCGTVVRRPAPTGRTALRVARLRPGQQPDRRASAAAEPAPSRPAGKAVVRPDADRPPSNPASVARLYDRALARTTVHGHRALQRYVSVLVAGA